MTLKQSPNLNQLWANLVIEELVRNGITYFCLSPGSRCAPLTAAVANNPKAESCVHYDERGAAFHALGYISATKRPCVLICTSGTAGANYFPAVIEASKKKLPLIVLTADRPPELRFTGADQTIDQVGLFGQYVRWHFDLPCPTKDIKPQVVLTSVDQAVYRTKGNPPGPVHLNCMFREPLAPSKVQANYAHYLKDLTVWELSETPYTSYIPADKTLTESKRKQIASILRKINRGAIVVGKLSNTAEQKAVLALAHKLQWPVFPDVSSGLRLGEGHKNVVSYYDQILLSEKFQTRFGFDGILHLGGRITSKRWYQFVERSNPSEYIMVLNHPLRNDPLHNVTLRVECDVLNFCNSLIGINDSTKEEDTLTQLQKASQKVEETVENFLSKQNLLCEPMAARLISKHMLKGHGLFLASSMPIRDMDMYAATEGAAVTVGANRGASGIDGTVATAAGFSVGLNKPMTLLIGDLALLHDLNSLGLLSSLKHPMVVVVLNNNGGGIFSFLPIAQFENIFESYFGTPHSFNFQSAAEMFRLGYTSPATNEEFTEEYQNALKSHRSTIIEVNTNREQNLKIHEELQKRIAKNLNQYFQKGAPKAAAR